MSRGPNPRRPESRETAPSAGSQRPLCSGSFPDGPPSLSSAFSRCLQGSLCWGWRNRGGGCPPRLRNGLFPSFASRCFSNCGHSGLHSSPARGESAVVRITTGGPPQRLPHCSWLLLGWASGRQAPLPCWPPPCPHTAPPAGAGVPTLLRPGPPWQMLLVPSSPRPPQPRCPGSPTAALGRPAAFPRASACLAPARDH